MIAANAKCVVNGPKVNEAITAFNPLLNMTIEQIAEGGGRVVYGAGGVVLLIPSGIDGYDQEELDVVDPNNAPSTRFFWTSREAVSDSGSDSSVTGSGTGTSTSTSGGNPNRDGLSIGGNGGTNRDNLVPGTSSGIPREDGSGGANGFFGGGGGGGPAGIPREDGTGGANGFFGGGGGGGGPAGIPKEGGGRQGNAPGGGVDAFGNNIGGVAGIPREGGGKYGTKSGGGSGGQPMDAGGGNLFSGGGSGGGGGDGGGGSSKGGGGGGGDLSHLHSKINTLQQQLDKAKRNDKYIWNNEAGRWDFKKFGDPPNDTVLSLTNQLEIAKKSLKSAQTNNK